MRSYMLVIALISITLKPTYSSADVVSDKRGDFVMEFMSIHKDKDKRLEAMKFISRDFFNRMNTAYFNLNINSYPLNSFSLKGICGPFVDVYMHYSDGVHHDERLLRFKVIEESGKLAIVPYDHEMLSDGYVTPWWQTVTGHLEMPDADCKPIKS